MKFFDGWMPKKGLNVFSALLTEDVEVDGHSLTAWVCLDKDRMQEERRPIGGTMMTVRYSSPMEGVIRVRMVHHTGSLTDTPSFIPDDEVPLDITEGEDCFEIRSGTVSVKLNKGKGFYERYLCCGREFARSDDGKMAYIIDGDDASYIKTELKVDIGETIYGLGERFTPFVRNGQTVEIFNMNGGSNTDQVYKNVPFFFSSRGYGVLVNDTGKVSYEICTENVENIQFSISGEALEYCVIAGPTIKDVLRRYTNLTGKPALPPAWTFGLWLTTSFTTDYDEETVTSFIDGMREREIPLRVFHYDCFWMKGGHWVDFEWDRRFFPDPEAMLKRVKARGLKICLWINPYVGQRSRLFEEGKKRGYFIKNRQGGVWQTDIWQPGMAIIDFTNPEACRWYQGELRRLIHMGADTFKTDFGERIPTDGVYWDGSDPEKMHNYYAHLYNRTVFEVLTEELGGGEANLFARSATAGGQKYPVHWGGDNEATYLSMAESLRGGLSLCSCGFGFWSHDISGFGKTATPDLYKRWSAFGMLSTHSRLHGNASYRVPWLFDEEAVDVLRFFARLKNRLMPYLYANAVHTHECGIPMMRPLIMEFMDDPACAYIDRQFMMGDCLMVAPVFREDGYVEYYLPKGRWTNLITGSVLEGSSWHRDRFDYFSLPLMVRENSIIAMGEHDGIPDYDYEKNSIMHLFEINGHAQTDIVTKTGKQAGSICALKEGSRLTVTVSGNIPGYRLCLRNVRSVRNVAGASVQSAEDGIMLIPDAGAREIAAEYDFCVEARE